MPHIYLFINMTIYFDIVVRARSNEAFVSAETLSFIE